MRILENIKLYSKENRVAAVVDGEELTYKELEKRSNALAYYLLKEFNEDRTPVVLYGNKENDMLVAMMAALKSGRAYVPVDITFPKDRIENILKEVNPKVVINCTTDSIDVSSDIISLDRLNFIYNNYGENEIDSKYWVKDDENCYILFTSGSTGKPKGVQISKNNLDFFTEWFTEYLKVGNENKSILNQPSYSFDLSVMPVYLGLINGKKLFSLSKKTLENMKETFNELKKSDMRLWISTPAFAAMCMQDDSFNNELMTNIETMYFIGEILPSKLVIDIRKRFPNVRIINSYGPTEATVAITGIDITQDIITDNKELPIGYPMKGSIIKILDDNNNEVKDGEKGEITIYSKSVSKGYYNNDEMTAKVFFNEVIDGKEYRAYKTGDLGYYKDGILYFCGRKDFQIKLNGFRIELEDIENNLRKVSNIKNTIVLPVYREQKVSHLVAFVILEEETGLSNLKNTLKIKDELKKYIPAYMIPKNIKVVKEFPMNNNDKVDRKRLMEEFK
ncbi:MAG: D-alanine--poly(phosphoribitol) ligase subunit DltA [Clostridium sp.]|uniref:D-alanine--poly(phosphoribitol) ligase subunit DltA n=1 Tax=Clostridium sp. TaxID=1506 RepID=UPI00290C81EB|nr:D-alanine--poly(phosphoribitol) ligase subunit DltA [Clostridium sp.]MDU5111025.1 D-alanine--poly(phosphoribitol) ligase subunit DltA [Clostridium sp.]